MADGTIKILTALDESGITKGLASIKGKVSSAAKSFGSSLKAGLTGITGALGVVSGTIGGVATAAVKAGMDFESQMSRVKAISGATESEFKQLSAQAKQLGADTAFSATEAAQGMENLAAAGFNTQEITKAMPGLLDMAAASGEDLATSSDIAASSLRAFGLDASQAGHVADVLAANANMTNAAIVDTGYAFKYAAPLAHSLGISMEETAASIGIMANAGIKGEQAGTTLRGALTRLVKPTKQVQAAADNLGVSFFDQQGKIKPLATIIGDLQSATKGLSDEQKNAALAAIFGTESLSGMLALVNAGPAELKKLTKAYQESDGAAKKAADTMMDNLGGAVEQLKGSLETLGIEFYESVDNPAKEVFQDLTEDVNTLTDAFRQGGLNDMIEKAGDLFADWAVRVADAAPKLIDAGTNAILAFVKGIDNNADALADSAVKIGKSLIGGLSKIVPEVAKAGGDLAVSLAGSLFGTQGEAAVRNTINAIKSAFANLAPAIKTAIDSIIQIIGNLGTAVSRVAQVILPPLSSALGFVASHLETILPLVAGVVTAFKTFSAVKAATSAVLKFSEAASSIVKVGSLADKAITGIWTAASAAAGPLGIAIAAFTGVATAIGAAVIASGDFISTNDRLKESNENLANSYGEILTGIQDFQDGVSNAKGILEGMNTELIVSSEDSQRVSSEMKSVQDKINSIAKTASDERRALTDSEIESLDKLFQKMHELADQQTQLNQARQKAVQSRAIDTAGDKSLDPQQYQEESQSIINSAQEARDATIDAANAAYENEYALIQKRTDLTEQDKERQIASAKETRKKTVAEAKKQADETTATLANGYTANASNLQSYVYKTAGLNTQYLANEEAYKNKKAQIDAEVQQIVDKRNAGLITSEEAQNRISELKEAGLQADETYKNEQIRIQDELSSALDNSTKQQIYTLLGYVANSGLAYDQLDTQTQAAVATMMTAFSNLSPEGKKVIDDMLDSMGMELAANGDLVYKAGEKAGQVVVKMSSITGSANLDAPTIKTPDGERPAREAYQQAQAYLNAHPLTSRLTIHGHVVYDNPIIRGQAGPIYSDPSLGIIGHAKGGFIPHAAGGIVEKPVVAGKHLFGEAGPEAVLPLTDSVYDKLAGSIIKALESGKYVRRFDPSALVDTSRLYDTGAQIAAGIARGMDSKGTSTAASSLANNIVDTLRDELEIHSPSKKLADKVGQYIPMGIVDGIVKTAQKATKEAKDLSSQILTAATDWMSHKKAMDQITVAEEIDFWQQMKKARGLGADELQDIDEKIYAAQKQFSANLVSDAQNYISHKQALDQISADEELAYWEKILNTRGLMADEREEVEEKIYAAQKQIVSDAESYISEMEQAYDWGAKDEIQYWRQILNTKKLAANQIEQINNKIIDLEKQAEQELADEYTQMSQDNYDYFDKFIEEDKFYDRIDTEGELKRWQAVYDDYTKGLIYLQSDEVEKIKKNIYSLQKELEQAEKDSYESRVESFKSWAGLFDEPSYDWEVSDEELMWNLEDQVRMMQQWSKDMQTLASRGVSSAMLQELQELGPAAADKVHALVDMTDSELQRYNNLYATKNQLAENMASQYGGASNSSNFNFGEGYNFNPLAGFSATASETGSTTAASYMASFQEGLLDQMPSLQDAIQKAGSAAGDAYGTAFAQQAQKVIDILQGQVQASATTSQAQITSVMQAAGAAAEAVDTLKAQVDDMQAVNLYANVTAELDGRQVAKGTAQYMGTYLKLRK